AGCGRHGDIEAWRNRAAERWERKRERWERNMQRWSGNGGRYNLRPSGNRAFDEYREEALRRLEDEATEFRDFLQRLRMAKDRAEFDDFMRDRRNRQGDANRGSDPSTPPPTQAP